jgi:hypothetical protein
MKHFFINADYTLWSNVIFMVQGINLNTCMFTSLKRISKSAIKIIAYFVVIIWCIQSKSNGTITDFTYDKNGSCWCHLIPLYSERQIGKPMPRNSTMDTILSLITMMEACVFITNDLVMYEAQ